MTLSYFAFSFWSLQINVVRKNNKKSEELKQVKKQTMEQNPKHKHIHAP